MASPLLADVTFHYADDQVSRAPTRRPAAVVPLRRGVKCVCAQVEASSLTQAAFPVLLAGAELAVAGAGVGAGGGSGLRATVRGAAGGGGGGRAPLERAAAVQRLEPQQASFVERLWAYLTVSGRGVAWGRCGGRGRERCASVCVWQVRQLLERADGGDAQAKERARELALRYAFVALSAGTELKSDEKMTFAYGSC